MAPFPDSDKVRERPFGPPAAPPAPRLAAIVAFLVAVLALYLGLEWWQTAKDKDKAAAPTPPAAAPQTPATQRPAPAPVPAPAPPANRTSPISPATPGPSGVTKCVAPGKTTYSDNGCPPGATATAMPIRPGLNIADAPRPQTAPAKPEPTAPAPSAPASLSPPPTPDMTAAKLECQQLDEVIKSIDAAALRPNGPHMQDWLAAQRRGARDRQYRLKC